MHTARAAVVGLQPTVIASRALHLLLERAKGPGQNQNNLTLICSLGANFRYNLIEFIKNLRSQLQF